MCEKPWNQQWYKHKEQLKLDMKKTNVKLTVSINDTVNTGVLNFYQNDTSNFIRVCNNLMENHGVPIAKHIINDLKRYNMGDNVKVNWDDFNNNTIEYLAGIERQIALCILQVYVLNKEVIDSGTVYNHYDKKPALKFNWRSPDCIMQLNGGVQFRNFVDRNAIECWRRFGYDKLSCTTLCNLQFVYVLLLYLVACLIWTNQEQHQYLECVMMMADLIIVYHIMY